MMNLPKYRVFVCTKQRDPNAPEGCCHQCGALEIYQAFQKEIEQRQLENQVEIRRSGCLDRCEAGAVALVYQPQRQEFSWLPMKLRLKLRRLLFANKHWYGHLTRADIPAIVDSHFVNGQPLKQCQI
jgi:(2Fe-2S) ferredoxin